VLLAAALHEADTRVDALPLLSTHEITALELVCVGRASDEPDEPVLLRFERFARELPNAVAARHGKHSLTYGELDARATQLARHLRLSGVRAESMVGVCLPPSLDVLVSILAIFKAGGVYVPLDPTHPRALVAMIVEETKPKLVLTHASFAGHPLPEDAPLLCLDRDFALVEQAPADTVLPAPQVEQSAYVLYTSGTTGKPKGVLATQRNLAHYLKVARQRFGFRREDTFCSLARYTFSISFFELLSPLAAGASVILLDRDEVLDPARLTAVLEQVTVVHAGPSLLGNLFRHLRANGTRTFANLRHASSGGDMVPPHLLEEMKQVFNEAELFVIYGCTEISCMGSAYPVRRNGVATRSFVGRPFSDVTVRVLDEHGNLVPFGVTGEIYFAGKGVASRYLARPELTSERFVCFDGQRFYRTGDLGRVHADGNVEMLGRRDFQVQLRGIRVELGGIEATVRELGLAAQCVVIAAARDEHDVRLVAFVVEPQVTDAASFRKALAARLPDYMLPQGLVVLETMPVTANGKLDRMKLRELAFQAPRAGGSKRAAEGVAEQAVAAAFATVLGVRDVGADDDFFDLGGHSLSCVLLMEELQNKLGISVSPGLLFEHTTVAAIAKALYTGSESAQRPILLSQSADKPALFLLLGVHLYRELARRLQDHYSVYGVYAGSELALFEGGEGPSVTTLAAEYVSLIKRQQPVGPYRVGGMSFGGIVAYEVAQLLRRAGDEVEHLLLIDAVLPEAPIAKVLRLAKMPRIELARELQHRLRARLVAPSNVPVTDGLVQSHDDDALNTLEEQRQAAYRSAARDYRRSIEAFAGRTTLIVAGKRLQGDKLLDPRCGFAQLVCKLAVYKVAATHLGLLEAGAVGEVARCVLSDTRLARESDASRMRHVA
jgi:amino acid adenylation domain-containing protein